MNKYLIMGDTDFTTDGSLRPCYASGLYLQWGWEWLWSMVDATVFDTIEQARSAHARRASHLEQMSRVRNIRIARLDGEKVIAAEYFNVVEGLAAIPVGGAP